MPGFGENLDFRCVFPQNVAKDLWPVLHRGTAPAFGCMYHTPFRLGNARYFWTGKIRTRSARISSSFSALPDRLGKYNNNLAPSDVVPILSRLAQSRQHR